MEYITLRLHSTNEVEQWYVRHNYLLHRQHVSTYMQVIIRPSITGKSIKCYTYMELSVIEGLKMTCIQVETCRLCTRAIQ